MTKKFISIILALILIVSSISILSVTASAASVEFSYNRTQALNYAERNWNNGVGLCADFASKCIQAGGINVYKPRCVDLYRELNGTYGTSYKLTLTRGNKGSIKMSDNAGKLEKGEDPFEAGKRELKEETGLDLISINKINSNFFIFLSHITLRLIIG